MRGEVHVYRFDGTNWQRLGNSIRGIVDYEIFGQSVSLSSAGDIIAIGGPGYKLDYGRVQVYKLNGSTWDSLGSALIGDEDSDIFGSSVSLSGDGKSLAIGAPQNFLFAGYGYTKVFDWTGTAWIQRGLTLRSSLDGDEFGYSVSLATDGNSLAVGARDGLGYTAILSGRTHVYKWDGAAWTQLGDTIIGDNDYDLSGNSVSLAANGKIVAIGAPGDDTKASEGGKASVFEFLEKPTLTVDLGPDTNVCNTSVILDAGNPGATYLWNTKEKTQTITVDSSGTYYVTVTQGNLTVTDTIKVTQYQLNLPERLYYCDTMDLGTLDVGEGWDKILWNTDEYTQSIAIRNSEKYIVEVSNEYCRFYDTTEVHIYWKNKNNQLNGNPGELLGSHLSFGDSNTIAIGFIVNQRPEGVRVFSSIGNQWKQKGQDIRLGGENILEIKMFGPYTLTVLTKTKFVIYSWNGNAWIEKGLKEIGNSLALTIADSSSFGIFTSNKIEVHSWDGMQWQTKSDSIDFDTTRASMYSLRMPDANTIAIGDIHAYTSWMKTFFNRTILIKPTASGRVTIFSYNGSEWVEKGRFWGEDWTYYGQYFAIPSDKLIALGNNKNDSRKVVFREYVDGEWVFKGEIESPSRLFNNFIADIKMPNEDLVSITYSTVRRKMSNNVIDYPSGQKTYVLTFVWNGIECIQLGGDMVIQDGIEGNLFATAVDIYDAKTLAFSNFNTRTGLVNVFSSECEKSLVSVEEAPFDFSKLDDQEGFIVYPNPGNGIFNVKSIYRNNISSIEVYNMMGSLVQSNVFSFSTIESTIDLTSQPKGIYLVKVVGDKTETTLRVVIE